MNGIEKRKSVLELEAKRRRNRRTVLSVLGCIVVLVTAFMLMTPAITISQDVATQSEGFYQDDNRLETLEAGQGLPSASATEDAASTIIESTNSNSTEASQNAPYVSNDVVNVADANTVGVNVDDFAAADGVESEANSAEEAEHANEDEENVNAASPNAKGRLEVVTAGVADPQSTSDMPAQMFEAELVDEHDNSLLTVSVEAPEGALPKGATMKVEEIVDANILEAVKQMGEDEIRAAQTTDSATDDDTEADAQAVSTPSYATAIAVNITFYSADGTEIEPAHDVCVAMGSAAVRDAVLEATVDISVQSLAVVHIDDKQLAQLAGVDALSNIDEEHPVDAAAAKDVANVIDQDKIGVDIDREEVVFEASRFSVYGVVYASNQSAALTTQAAPVAAATSADAMLYAQNAVMLGDVVQTISNPAGTTIDLFDYWVVDQQLVGRAGWGDLNQSWGGHPDSDGLNGSGNNKGINASASDAAHGHALKFSPAWEGTVFNGTKNGWTSLNSNGRDGLNSYTGGTSAFAGIVQNTLAGGYPVLTNNATIGSNGESLAYLFDPTIAHNGKASYPNANQLFYVDKDGYYTYDSRDYAAAFDTGSKTFTLTEQTSSDSEIRGFWPFGTQNFWCGMHVNTQFSMPTGGQVLNPAGVFKPMQFEFSGDDDVWIYIDGVLVGDAGGIHNRTEVDINFQTGEVNITGQSTKYLDDLFRAAGAYDNYEWNGHTFADNTYHTFDFFYLERGGGESNLYVHYNLVSTADFTAHKAYYGSDADDILRRDQFQFELIGLDGKYRSVLNAETGAYELVLDNAATKAIMPNSADETGAGTVESPYYNRGTATKLSDGTTVGSQTYITGVTEDGNINFGSAIISELDMNESDQGNPPVYRYILKEIVPADAHNADGIAWQDATDEQKAAGGFVKDQVTYDGRTFYMTARVTSWTETGANGQQVTRHGLAKTYYTDDTYTVVDGDTTFVNFENRFTPSFGNVEFTKVDGAGHPLAGAAFALYTDQACTVAATDVDGAGNAWVATSGADGKVAFEHVRVGTYYMKETAAPTGYALDNAVYKVAIEDVADTSKSSKVTLVGDESATALTEIANVPAGELSVVKKWLDSTGAEMAAPADGTAVNVRLMRRHQVEEPAESHTVTVQMSVVNYNGNGDPQMFGTPAVKTVAGDTVVIEWDDEWQRNFNWELTVGSNRYEGYIGDHDEVVNGGAYRFEQIGVDGRSRRLTISGVDGDVTLTTKYHVNWLYTDSNHWANLNNPLISASGASASYSMEEDVAFNAAKHTAQLDASAWSHTWTIGGTDANHEGFDFAAVDADGQDYLYYVAELDADGNPIVVGESPLDGYVLHGYSANNNIGVADQGVITVYNKSTFVVSAHIDIVKVAKGTSTPLAGAKFTLTQVDANGNNVPGGIAKPEAEVDANGKLRFDGLVPGRYKLEETVVPDGYIKNEGPYYLVVSADGSSSIEDGHGYALIHESETVADQYTVENQPGAVLPSTGGPGTSFLYALGTALIALAVCVLTKRGQSLFG